MQRPDERFQRALGDHDEAQDSPAGRLGPDADGFGIGHEEIAPNTSETGIMAGGGGSEVDAIGDFDVQGNADVTAHQGVGGNLTGQAGSLTRPTEVDPRTGLSGRVTPPGHPHEQPDQPELAADDKHTGAAFPRN